MGREGRGRVGGCQEPERAPLPAKELGHDTQTQKGRKGERKGIYNTEISRILAFDDVQNRLKKESHG